MILLRYVKRKNVMLIYSFLSGLFDLKSNYFNISVKYATYVIQVIDISNKSYSYFICCKNIISSPKCTSKHKPI